MNLIDKIQAAIVRLPLWARKFCVDFIETAVATVAGLSLIVPGDMTAAKAEALIVGSAVFAALVSAARRAAPAAWAWFHAKVVAFFRPEDAA